MQLIRMTNCQAERLKGFTTSPRWNTMLLETGQWGQWSFQNATEAPVPTLLSSPEPKQNRNHPLEWHLALASECEHNASTTKVPTFASFVASNINFWCPVVTHIGSRTLNSQEKKHLVWSNPPSKSQSRSPLSGKAKCNTTRLRSHHSSTVECCHWMQF